MLLRRIYLFIVFFFIFYVPHAQVNLQTGSATFSLPMFNWNDNKSRLTSMVALSYNSGNGLKVNDVASNVGQGWSLVTGGVITRMQIGEPDDQIAKEGGDQDLSKYPNGYLYANIPANNGCPEALTKYPLFRERDQVYVQRNIVAEDKQQDYFAFQFNGKTGIFVVDIVNGQNVGISLGDSKMKISFETADLTGSQQTRTTITSFTIKDVDGLIYKFSRHGSTKLLQSNYCDPNLNQQWTAPKFKNGKVYHQSGFDNPGVFSNPWVIGSWHLTEIKDPLNPLRTVTFNYIDRDINTLAGEDITYNDGEKDYSIITHKRSIAKTPEIDHIIYPDGHRVDFVYGADRFDYAGQQAMASVNITYNGRTLSQYKLRTTYFIRNRYGTPYSEFEKKSARLCLKSVKKIGVDLKEDTPPYEFDYYLGSSTADDIVAPPFFYAKDIWGFYNGDKSVSYFGGTGSIPLTTTSSNLNNDQLRGLTFRHNGVNGVYINPKTGYARNGLLRQIIYPTGGTLSYEYEQNSGAFIGTQNFIEVGGVHVSKTSSTDGGQSNGCANPISTQYNYVLQGGTQSSMWGLEMPVNSLTMTSYYNPENKNFKWGSGCWFGCCYYVFNYPGILSQQQGTNLSDFQKTMETLAPALGILSTLSTIMNVVNLILGPTPLAWVAVIVDILVNVFALVFTCANDFSKTSSNTIYYNTDLNGASPLPAQFKRVEIVENPGSIGKTVQEFTNEDDYPIWEPSNPAFSAKQRFAPWAYGLPKFITVFDAAGNMVKQTQNVYNFNTTYSALKCDKDYLYRRKLLKNPINNISCKCFVTHTSSQRITNWSNPAIFNDPNSYKNVSYSDMKVDKYDLYTGRVELDTVYERVFKPSSSEYLETVTGYVYNDENYEVKHIRTILSDGRITQKNIYYTIDFVKAHGWCYDLTTQTTNNPEIIALVQNNIISLPVETNEQVGVSYADLKYTHDKATMFVTAANGDIKVSKILEGRFLVPDTRNSFWDIDYAMTTYRSVSPLLNPDNPDYNFYKIAQTFSYDANGNLIGLKDEGNRVVSNIYDYDDKYVTASVINADPSTDNVAYTSFETPGFGGWSLTGGQDYVSNAVTGARAFILNGRSLTRSINANKAYTISLWATAAINVNGGATLIKSAPSIGGYTYYEYSVPQGVSSITVSGNADIDELRIYPKAGRMRTVTYDPLIGKTSESDENNRVTYYEYDNLGRLRFIKDDNRNIVKMYEYNNISRPNGCPAIYYNRMITELFTKTTCGSGFIGSEVPYTVPANKYSSTISQEDADAQAENEIMENGQSYADAGNNGSCIPVYGNAQASIVVTTETCDPGFVGGTVTYTVPANRYFSTVPGEADAWAQEDIEANSQSFANAIANKVCLASTGAEWTWDNLTSNCQVVNGENHLFIRETDLNPNSATYNQTRWSDVGVQAECPPVPCTLSFNWAQGINYTTSHISLSGTTVSFVFVFEFPANTTSVTAGNLTGACTYPTSTRTVPITIGSSVFHVTISPSGSVQVSLVSGPMPSGSIGFVSKYDLNVNGFYSAAASGTYTRNNCAPGEVGSAVTYNVIAYKYFSTVSQPDADQQAQNDVAINGQGYANTQGTCTPTVTITGSNSRNVGYVISFTNGSYSQSFYILAGSNNATLGTIPQGTYNVQMFMPGGNPPVVNYTFGFYSSYNAVSASWSGVSITSTTHASVF